MRDGKILLKDPQQRNANSARVEKSLVRDRYIIVTLRCGTREKKNFSTYPVAEREIKLPRMQKIAFREGDAILVSVRVSCQDEMRLLTKFFVCSLPLIIAIINHQNRPIAFLTKLAVGRNRSFPSRVFSFSRASLSRSVSLTTKRLGARSRCFSFHKLVYFPIIVY
jgi:hypothetical protein